MRKPDQPDELQFELLYYIAMQVVQTGYNLIKGSCHFNAQYQSKVCHTLTPILRKPFTCTVHSVYLLAFLCI